jgi:UDP-N-acetylenolpyruvoylglucosamine reductase
MAFYVLYLSMIKTNIRTYNVEFTTAFAGSRFVNIVLEAKDEHQANWVARNLCRFGYISNTTKTDEVAAYTEATHAWAYDEDYEIYS